MPGLQGISLGSMEREEGLNRIHVRDLREEGGREGERETGGGASHTSGLRASKRSR